MPKQRWAGRSVRGVGRWAAVLALLLSAEAARGQDDLALRYLQTGMTSYRAGKYSLAARDLRIARFLSLETPGRHLEIIARLAVAEDASATPSARDASLDRFLAVEARFPEYEAASLEPDVRQRFQALVLKRFPRERILAIPALAEELGLIPMTTSSRRPSPRATATPVPPAPTETRPAPPAAEAAAAARPRRRARPRRPRRRRARSGRRLRRARPRPGCQRPVRPARRRHLPARPKRRCHHRPGR